MRVLLGMILTVGLIALACSSEATQAPATEPVAPAATVMPPRQCPQMIPMLEPTATFEQPESSTARAVEPTATLEPEPTATSGAGTDRYMGTRTTYMGPKNRLHGISTATWEPTSYMGTDRYAYCG